MKPLAEKAGRYVRYVALFVLVLLVVIYLRENPEAVRSLASLTPGTVAWVFGLALVTTILYAHSMYVFIRDQASPRIGFLSWQTLVFASRLANYVVPQGANLYKSFYLKRRYAVPHTRYIGVVAFHSWLFAAATLWVSTLGSLLYGSGLRLIILQAVVALLVTLLLPLLSLAIALLGRTRSGSGSWIEHRLAVLRESISRMQRDGHSIGVLLAIVAVTFLFTVVAVQLISGELLNQPDLRVSVILAVVFTLTKFINVVPGNLGLTELLAGLALEALGGTLAFGIVISAVLRVVELAVTVLLGAASLLVVKQPLPGSGKDASAAD